MKIVPYEEKYYTDVMNCLSRNFRTMSGLEEGEVYDIVKGIFSYPWIDSDIPYSRGVVLLDNEENLVGYLGAVYTRKLVSERWLTICNFSTWAIDSKFRIFVFSCLKEFHRTADVFLDYSPNEASIQIERQMFMYKDIENEIFVFKPHPYIGAGSLKVRIIRDESKIYDEDVRKKYLDHKGLGVKCCEVITPDGIPQYMFYDILAFFKDISHIFDDILPVSSDILLFFSGCFIFFRYIFYAFKDVYFKRKHCFVKNQMILFLHYSYFFDEFPPSIDILFVVRRKIFALIILCISQDKLVVYSRKSAQNCDETVKNHVIFIMA